MAKPTKNELNKLARELFGEGVECTYSRSTPKGWHLHKGDEKLPLGANASEALKQLQALVPSTPIVQIDTSTEHSSEVPTTSDSKPDVLKAPVSGTEIDSKIGHSTKVPTTTDSKPDIPKPQAILEELYDTFPKAFFRAPEKVKPLRLYIQNFIKKKLKKYPKHELRQALVLYTQTKAYCEALARGGCRIDLEGNEVATQKILPGHVEDAKARSTGDKPMRMTGYSKPLPRVDKPPPEPNEIIESQGVFMVKINELPSQTQKTQHGWESFYVQTKKYRVKVAVRPRTWNKLIKANQEWPAWIAHIEGKVGPKLDEDSFELLRPAVKIFQRKVKETLE